MRYRVLRLCRTSAAMEAIPERRMNLDLYELEKRLRSAGYEIITNLGPIMVAKKDVEITIYDTGKLLLKTKDEGKARKEIEEMEKLIGQTLP